MAITHISFDLDGTLEHGHFDKVVWNVEIPKLYAKEHNMSIEEAQRHVFAEYYKALYIENIANWTDVGMWFNRLGLQDWHALLQSLKAHIRLYEDTIAALEELSRTHTLVLISNSEDKFLDLKLDATGLRKYFTHIFSSNTFKLSKKDKEAFQKPLEALQLTASQLLHIGNEQHADYEVPTSVGISALLIDRKKEKTGAHIIHSLHEVQKHL